MNHGRGVRPWLKVGGVLAILALFAPTIMAYLDGSPLASLRKLVSG